MERLRTKTYGPALGPVQKLCIAGLLVAMAIVLDSVGQIVFTPTNKLTLTFLPISLCGMLLGPVYGGIAGGVADIIGYFIGGQGMGAFMPQFTVPVILEGVLAGLLLRPLMGDCTKTQLVSRIVLYRIAVNAVCYILLNTWFLSLLSGTEYFGMLITRLPKYMIIPFVEMFLLVLVAPLVKKSLLAVNRSFA